MAGVGQQGHGVAGDPGPGLDDDEGPVQGDAQGPAPVAAHRTMVMPCGPMMAVTVMAVCVTAGHGLI